MSARRSFLAIFLVTVMLSLVAPAFAVQEGTLTIGPHVTLASRWLEPGLIGGFPYAGPFEDLKIK